MIWQEVQQHKTIQLNKSFHGVFIEHIHSWLYFASTVRLIFFFLFTDLDAIRPQISISPKVNVVEGDRVQIKCQVQYPSVLDLFLTKGNTVLRQYHTTFTYSLTVRAEDSGDYVCKAEKGSVQKRAVYGLNVRGN